jgi:hypothetical protein
MTSFCVRGERRCGGFMKTLTVYEYCIVKAAIQAKENLKDPHLHLRGEIRKNLKLLRLGQEVLARVRGRGAEVPEIDLSYPPSATAAPSHVKGRKASAGNELE